MAIEDIKRTDLTQNERDVLAADTERWKHMGAGAHLQDWLNFYTGLDIRRRLAMRLAHTNQPAGRGYNEMFSTLMREDGIDTADKSAMTAFTAVMWLNEDPERLTILREILNAMTPGQRARLNSPISARQRVEGVLKARAKGEAAEAKVKDSPVALLRAQVAEKDREIATLKAKLAKGEDGSLFDLARDNVEDIARTIVGNVGVNKARSLHHSLGQAIAAAPKPKPPKRPAG